MLSSFLASGRRALTGGSRQPLTLVVGNESADLDSICSALVFALLRSRCSDQGLHVPVSNVWKADLGLRRPELAVVFAGSGVAEPEQELLTLSDLPDLPNGPNHSVERGQVRSDTRIFLVDHNVPTGKIKEWAEAKPPVGCIDHHPDEGVVPADSGLEPRVIRTAGSCSSLVTDYCRPLWETLRQQESPETVAAAARIALAPILVDTNGLRAAERVTQTDLDAAAYLQRLIQSAGGPTRADSFLADICREEGNLAPLSLRDILRKDYKEWTAVNGLRLGMSSSPQHMDWLVANKGPLNTFKDGVESWAAEQELDLVAVSTAAANTGSGSFTRNLLLLARNGRAAQAMQRFIARHGQQLQLTTWSGGELDRADDQTLRRCWHQQATAYSRKQLAPMLREAINDV